MAKAVKDFCSFMNIKRHASISFNYKSIPIGVSIQPNDSVALTFTQNGTSIFISPDGDASSEGHQLKLNKEKTAFYQQVLSDALKEAQKRASE